MKSKLLRVEGIPGSTELRPFVSLGTVLVNGGLVITVKVMVDAVYSFS